MPVASREPRYAVRTEFFNVSAPRVDKLTGRKTATIYWFVKKVGRKLRTYVHREWKICGHKLRGFKTAIQRLMTCGTRSRLVGKRFCGNIAG
jgi:hypothetical protein